MYMSVCLSLYIDISYDIYTIYGPAYNYMYRVFVYLLLLVAKINMLYAMFH